MRKIVYGTTILVGVLLGAIVVGHLPRVATASHDKPSGAVDVLKLHGQIDTKALPKQELAPEVYQ